MTTFRSFCGSVCGLKKLLVLYSGQLVLVPEEQGFGPSVSDHQSTTTDAYDSSSAKSSHPPESALGSLLLITGHHFFRHSDTSICEMNN